MGRFNLALLLLTWSGALYACPDLAGRYVCVYKDNRQSAAPSREDLFVTQGLVGDVVAYQYNGSELITDGNERALPDDAEMKQTRLRVWCDDGAVRGRLRARYFEGGGYAGELELLFTYARVGANVRQITEGKLAVASGTLPLASDVTCEPAR